MPAAGGGRGGRADPGAPRRPGTLPRVPRPVGVPDRGAHGREDPWVKGLGGGSELPCSPSAVPAGRAALPPGSGTATPGRVSPQFPGRRGERPVASSVPSWSRGWVWSLALAKSVA